EEIAFAFALRDPQTPPQPVTGEVAAAEAIRYGSEWANLDGKLCNDDDDDCGQPESQQPASQLVLQQSKSSECELITFPELPCCLRSFAQSIPSCLVCCRLIRLASLSVVVAATAEQQLIRVHFHHYQ